MNFDEAFNELMKHEGGFANHPADPGGKTMFGITGAVAAESGYHGDMINIPTTVVRNIYFQQYWKPIHADNLPAPIRYAVFDAAVNSGVGQAIRWLQRALGVADDGKIGRVTLGAVHQADPAQVLRLMLASRLDFMTRLSTWDSFGRGWARRIANLLNHGWEDES